MKHRTIGLLAAAGLAFAISSGDQARAATLDEIFQAQAEIVRLAQASQDRVDTLSEETSRLLEQYKAVLKEIDGLRVYNAQLQRQIDSQNREMQEITASIERVTLIERQITPLMMRMVEGLEQFIELDMPFLLDERRERIATLRDMMDRADVSPSEKFRRVFEAYQIENEYGRTIEATNDVLPVAGSERTVQVLRIGRIALLYQTEDGSVSGFWNKDTGQWQELDDEYASSISEGIRIASNQTSPNLIRIPIPAPE